MDERKKKIVFFIVSLFVAIMFITSYAAFNNNSISNNTNSTNQTAAKTYLVVGSYNAVVAGYATGATVLVSNSAAAELPSISNTLAALENNGSITYSSQNSSFQVITQNFTAYRLQQYLSNSYAPNAVIVNTTTYVKLPARVPLNYSNQKVNVLLTRQNFSVVVEPIPVIGANVPVIIRALVTANGTVYNNQIKVIAATP